MGLLSLAIWTPIFFGAVLLALGRDDQARTVRWLALIGALVSLLVTLPLDDVLAIGLVITDLTEHKLNQQLQDSDRRKDEFLAMVS